MALIVDQIFEQIILQGWRHTDELIEAYKLISADTSEIGSLLLLTTNIIRVKIVESASSIAWMLYPSPFIHIHKNEAEDEERSGIIALTITRLSLLTSPSINSDPRSPLIAKRQPKNHQSIRRNHTKRNRHRLPQSQRTRHRRARKDRRSEQTNLLGVGLVVA
jgi:hypothetical protein